MPSAFSSFYCGHWTAGPFLRIYPHTDGFRPTKAHAPIVIQKLEKLLPSFLLILIR